MDFNIHLFDQISEPHRFHILLHFYGLFCAEASRRQAIHTNYGQEDMRRACADMRNNANIVKAELMKYAGIPAERRQK